MSYPVLIQEIGEMIKAICWTFFHSLWQGILLAVLAAVFILLTGKTKPICRYVVFVSLIIVFLIVTAATALYELRLIHLSEGAGSSKGRSGLFISFTGSLQSDTEWLPSFVAAFNNWAPFLFLAWSAFFILRLRQLAKQIDYLRQLTKTATIFPDAYWQEKLTQLAFSMKLNKPVQLQLSAKINVPVLIGYLKPVILLPIGFINNLSPEQLETVLIHELAHIRRHDYLINRIQVWLEAVFFFNPAFLWLSRLVRMERENCCDETVVEKVKGKEVYIFTLVSTYEFSMNTPDPGVYFSSHYTVASRVQRMMEGRNRRLGLVPAFLLSFGILLCLLISMDLSNKEVQNSTLWSQGGIALHFHTEGQPCYQAACKKLKDRSPRDSMEWSKNMRHVENMEIEKEVKEVIRILLGERVIDSTQGLSFRLDKERLIVNGQEQPSCILQILHDRFFKKSSIQEIEYHFSS